MAHNLEEINGKVAMAFSGKQLPWHGLGTNISAELTHEEILKAASLDWKVNKKSLHTIDSKGNYINVPDNFALVRDIDDSILDVVGPSYQPVQNSAAFEFFKRFLDAGAIHMDTAGSIDKGRRIWGLGKLNSGFSIGNTDRVEGYILLTNTHKYGYSIQAKTTTVRVVCNNTLDIAIRDNTANAFKCFHSQSFDAKIMDYASNMIANAINGMKKFEEAANILAQKAVSEKQAKDFFINLVEGKKTNSGEISSQAEKKILEMIDIYQHAVGQDTSTAKGTAWGLLNAVTYHSDHIAMSNSEKRLASNWFGTLGNVKQKALDMALAI